MWFWGKKSYPTVDQIKQAVREVILEMCLKPETAVNQRISNCSCDFCGCERKIVLGDRLCDLCRLGQHLT